MRILISADYLIASAFCAPENVRRYYLGLANLKKEFDSGRPVFLEADIVSKLSERGLYPSLDLFKKNIPRAKDYSFGAEDIARLVNYLLSRVAQLNVNDDIVADWSALEVDAYPDFHSDCDRDSQLSQAMVDLSLLNAGFGYEHILMHYHAPGIPPSATVTGVIASVEPNQFPVPKPVNHTTQVSETFIDYIKIVDALKIYQAAENDHHMKRALYFGVVQFLLQHGEDPHEFDENSFILGEEFRQSAIRNECSGHSAFSSAFFDAVVRVLAGKPKNEINMFQTSAGSGKQRTRGGKSAWRTHITESGRALRLMFWIHSSGLIELANVGNKKECEIA